MKVKDSDEKGFTIFNLQISLFTFKTKKMKTYLFYKDGGLFLALDLYNAVMAVRVGKMFKKDFDCDIQISTLINQAKRVSII